ncbi:MAG: NADH-quinone oxidoreductase subunit C [Bacteroidota bacterium]|jgi:NADH-quinone oxidoreductase subunit C
MKDAILEKIKSQFKNAVESTSEFRGEVTIVVRKQDIVDVCRFLRDDDELQFDMLKDLCGADYFRPEDRFEVVYNLYSLKNKYRLRLKVRVDESDLHVPSMTPVWPGANWHERETNDMYGIVFDGHPDLRRIYMPEEFEHYPLRKDFPLMGIPGSLPLPRK